jgi:coenzyme F420 hydrogenase subunit beta
MANVTTKQICIGCGVCAGVCPTNHLRMVDNGFGEYRPLGEVAPCTDCSLCFDVCPFEKSLNEDVLAERLYSAIEGIQHAPETGYFHSSYCGGVSSDALRWSRTSGGLATWMLSRLIETRTVDRVISVVSTSDPTKLFEFAEFETAESLWNAARSSYYPVEISCCLRSIARSGLRYAVIGLPCIVKGIRRAQSRMPSLNTNIPVLLGLVCGQQRSKWFAEYLVRCAGQRMESVRRVSFREKHAMHSAKAPDFAVWNNHDELPHRVERAQEYGHAWDRSYFKQDACDYCDDVFAELADAVFMDAWLPAYQDDPRGTSIVTVRSAVCRELLLASLQSSTLRMTSLNINDVIRSQQGCLRLKRGGTSLQISLMSTRELEFYPRVRPTAKWRIFARYRKAAENRRVAASRTAFQAQRSAGPGLRTFQSKIMTLTLFDTLLLGALSLLAVPRRVFRKMRLLNVGPVAVS